jgi:hypothetical protein
LQGAPIAGLATASGKMWIVVVFGIEIKRDTYNLCSRVDISFDFFTLATRNLVVKKLLHHHYRAGARHCP